MCRGVIVRIYQQMHTEYTYRCIPANPEERNLPFLGSSPGIWQEFEHAIIVGANHNFKF